MRINNKKYENKKRMDLKASYNRNSEIGKAIDKILRGE